MRFKTHYLACLLIAAFCAGATPQATEKLTLPEIAARPEFWPDRVTLKVDLNFGGGKSFKAGQQFDVFGLASLCNCESDQLLVPSGGIGGIGGS